MAASPLLRTWYFFGIVVRFVVVVSVFSVVLTRVDFRSPVSCWSNSVVDFVVYHGSL